MYKLREWLRITNDEYGILIGMKCNDATMERSSVYDNGCDDHRITTTDVTTNAKRDARKGISHGSARRNNTVQNEDDEEEDRLSF